MAIQAQLVAKGATPKYKFVDTSAPAAEGKK